MTTRKATTRRTNITAHILLLAVVLVWGVTFPLVKAALADVSPLLFNLLRMAIGFAVLAAVNWKSLRGVSRSEWKMGAAAGLFLALGYQLQTVGLARTTASKSAFITGLVVVFVPLLSCVRGVAPKDAPRPSAMTFAGAVLAFCGLVLLTAPKRGDGAGWLSGLGGGFHAGEWLTLGCAVAFAMHLLTLARAAPRMPARRLGTLQVGFAALVMLVTLPVGGRLVFHSTAIVWLALAVTALLATAAAFTIQSWVQQHLAASHTALITTMEPVFAWAFSLLFLGERMGARGLTGAAMILAGIVAAEAPWSSWLGANSAASPGIL
jgi:drug/metabolite transporter (DMT)-like permease